jgi:TorA maturation chaperone TorD
VLGEDGGPDSTDDWARLIDALRDQSEPPRDEYDRVFGLVVPKECPPCETEYYPTVEMFARSQQMADIAGFYHAFGIEPSHSWPERPDHLSLELEFLAFLLMKRRIALRATDPGSQERAEICEHALRDFVSEHLAWWVPTFAAGLARKAGPTGYHAALARVLTTWIPAECRRLGIASVLRPVRPELIETPEEQTGCASCPLNI